VHKTTCTPVNRERTFLYFSNTSLFYEITGDGQRFSALGIQIIPAPDFGA
jgi:hypothetical protein